MQMKECSLGSECYGQTPLLFIQKWQRKVGAGRERGLEGGAGRGGEQIQTRWRLEEGMDGGMRGQVCAGGPYMAWMTGEL